MCYYVSEEKLHYINIQMISNVDRLKLLTKYTLFRIQCD